MGKIWVEVSLVSAHGLGHSPSLWKRQWFAVGWIDPNFKYCTKVDDSGNENPVWKTKFAILVDDSESDINIQDLVLNVEVHSIDPIFLTEKIHGTAPVIIKANSEVSLRPGNEEVRSYQLRKKDSDKPRGFIDISIRILEEKKEQNSKPGVNWRGKKTTEIGSEEKYSKHLPLASPRHQKNEARTNIPCSYRCNFLQKTLTQTWMRRHPVTNDVELLLHHPHLQMLAIFPLFFPKMILCRHHHVGPILLRIYLQGWQWELSYLETTSCLDLMFLKASLMILLPYTRILLPEHVPDWPLL